MRVNDETKELQRIRTLYTEFLGVHAVLLGNLIDMEAL